MDEREKNIIIQYIGINNLLITSAEKLRSYILKIVNNPNLTKDDFSSWNIKNWAKGQKKKIFGEISRNSSLLIQTLDKLITETKKEIEKLEAELKNNNDFIETIIIAKNNLVERLNTINQLNALMNKEKLDFTELKKFQLNEVELLIKSYTELVEKVSEETKFDSHKEELVAYLKDLKKNKDNEGIKELSNKSSKAGKLLKKYINENDSVIEKITFSDIVSVSSE